MRFKLLLILFIFILFIAQWLPSIGQAVEKDGNQAGEYFDISLNGYDLYGFGSFNQVGYKITPLAQLYFTIIQLEQEWIDEPRLYIKGNKGYVHLWKRDGTNVLYSIQKEVGNKEEGIWKIFDVKRTKINRVPVPKMLLKEAFIERLVNPISEAIEKHTGEPKLWYRGFEKIIKIEKDERNFIFYVTIQVMTFEGAHGPPFGEETMTFRIRGGGNTKVIDYKHRDIPEEKWKKLKLR